MWRLLLRCNMCCREHTSSSTAAASGCKASGCLPVVLQQLPSHAFPELLHTDRYHTLMHPCPLANMGSAAGRFGSMEPLLYLVQRNCGWWTEGLSWSW